MAHPTLTGVPTRPYDLHRGSRIDAALRAKEEAASRSDAAYAGGTEPHSASGGDDVDSMLTRPAPTPPRAPPTQDVRRRPRPGAAPPTQPPTTYAERVERERAAALEDAELRRAALQARGVDLYVPAVRPGREPTVRNTRGGESLRPTVRGGVGVDETTAAAIERGARELSARRRGAKGAAETGTWHDKFLARYGLDKTAGR